MKIIVGISGASGIIYGIRFLEELKKIKTIETYLILTEVAEEMLKIETKISKEYLENLVTYSYNPFDFKAPISSGSFKTDGMIIIPCSMKSLSGIASGYSSNLMLRAADIMIKEKNRLVIVPRETPLNTIHLENMLKLSNLGVTILAAMPAYYHNPKTINEIINFIVGKSLESFGIKHNLYKKWE